MAIEYIKGKTTASPKYRVLIAVTLGLISGLIAGSLSSWYIAPLVAWTIMALVFIVWVWLTIWPLDSTLTASHALREDPSRGAADIVVLAASVASLAGVGMVLFESGKSQGSLQLLLIGLGVMSVVLSWAVIHTLFTLRYAELFYTVPKGGVDFHGETTPTYVDFAYLAFTIGMTFQVSDTSLQTKEFRRTALNHSLLSYMFGTVIVATTLNLVAGLSR